MLDPRTAPLIGIDRDMLISEIEYSLDEGGTVANLTVAPPDAFDPEPPLAANPVATTETAPQTEAIPALTGEPSGAEAGSRVGGCLPTCVALDPAEHRTTIAGQWNCWHDTSASVVI